MAAIFIVYYVVRYVFDAQYIDDVNNIFGHLKAVSLRPPYLKYLLVFAMEDILEMANGGAVDASGISLRVDYSALIYKNEDTVRRSF